MSQTEAPNPDAMNWWHSKVHREADRDELKLGERIGNVVAVFFIALVALFFWDLMGKSYSFFAPNFNTLDKVLFFGSLLFGIIPCLFRALVGKRNLGRFIDLFGSGLFIVVALYFLATFPFEFGNLVNLLPASARADLSWINNDLFRLLLEIGVVISAITLVYNAILYGSVRRELNERSVAK